MLCFRKFPVVEKMIDKRGGGGVSKVSVDSFFFTVPKNFVEEPFSVPLISGIVNFYASEGYLTIFVEIPCLTVPKKFVEQPFCAALQKTSPSEKVYG